MSKFVNWPKKSRTIHVISLVLVACLILVVGNCFFRIRMALSRVYEPAFVISSSPDNQYELVAREWSCLGGGGADVYIRKNEWYNRWNKQQIGTANPDDYYQTFSKGTYYVEWEDAKVTIYYYDGLAIENVNDRSTWRGVLSYEFD